MSYTNIELVKKHLNSPFPVAAQIFDQPVIINSEEKIVFFGGSIQKSSVLVKTIASNYQKTIDLTINGNETIFSTDPVVPGTVLVASNRSQSIIYVENSDFVIDYQKGKLHLKSGGSLSAGSTITLFFLIYTLYKESSDYSLDYDSGTIKKNLLGDIALHETVYLDYIPELANYTDDILNQAVVTANGLIEKIIDPDQQFGANPVLQTAATYRALSIICRTSAVRSLSSQNDLDKTATVWMKLADRYGELSDEMIKDFHKPFNSRSNPTLS